MIISRFLTLMLRPGCKNCANVASDVFAIEDDYGRARAYSQCGKRDLVQQAIDSWYSLLQNFCYSLVYERLLVASICHLLACVTLLV